MTRVLRVWCYMKYPNFNEEKKLWKKGYKCVVGLDEAGRGPLAGPVVATAVMINQKFEYQNSKQIQKTKIKNSKHGEFWKFENSDLDIVSDFVLRISNFRIRDSKLMSARQREAVYKKLTICPEIRWGVGIVSEKIIDKINILEATKLAMNRALDNLIERVSRHNLRYRVNYDDGYDCFLLIDGNFKLDLSPPAAPPQRSPAVAGQKSIIRGDQKVFSISAASIIAKETRDKIMQKYHKKYPQYGFNKHKGYGTKAHFANLEKFGPCLNTNLVLSTESDRARTLHLKNK